MVQKFQLTLLHIKFLARDVGENKSDHLWISQNTFLWSGFFLSFLQIGYILEMLFDNYYPDPKFVENPFHIALILSLLSFDARIAVAS